jgi:predicted ATP-grasp superfamily ATP-dependent carboligase
MRILVTNGNERVALAAVRSLRRAGHSVCVVARSRLSLAGVSAGVTSRVLATDALANPLAFARDLGGIAREERTEMVLPMTDASLEAVLEHRSALPTTVVVPFPNLSTYRAASDKAKLLGLAEACGFGVPESRVIATQRDSGAELPGVDFFPAVIKPHRSVVSSGGVKRKLEVTHVSDPIACRQVLEELPSSAFPVLLQRRVVGVGEGFFALRWNGRAVAMFAHRRLREKPPSGGVSVYRESIPLDERLVGPGLRLLDALDWNGVAMIECKREEATGRQVIMEVNGRFWGSLQLAIDAGVDFPAMLVDCAADTHVPRCWAYREGVRSRWFWGDVDQLYLRLRDGGWRSRLRALHEFLRIHPGRDRGEIFRWRDPAPFVVETLQWMKLLGIGRARTANDTPSMVIPDTADATSRSRAVPRGSVRDYGGRRGGPASATRP